MIDGVSYALFVDNTVFLASDRHPNLAVTYLGEVQVEVIYQRRGTTRSSTKRWYDKHVNYIVERVERSTKVLYSLLNRWSKLSTKSKLLVVK